MLVWCIRTAILKVLTFENGSNPLISNHYLKQIVAKVKHKLNKIQEKMLSNSI